MNKQELQIVGYIRGLLNEYGIPWGICEQAGIKINREVESCYRLFTDSGMIFEKKEEKKNEKTF